MGTVGRRLVGLALLVVLLAGCQGGQGLGTAGTVGGLGGAAAGGLLAAAVGGGATGIAAGTIIGGLLGLGVGSALDEYSRRQAAATLSHSLETAPAGTSATWRNPDNGNNGSVTPVRTYQQPNGAYCREFQQTITVGGRPEQSYGTACRQPDGSWRIVN